MARTGRRSTKRKLGIRTRKSPLIAIVRCARRDGARRVETADAAAPPLASNPAVRGAAVP